MWYDELSDEQIESLQNNTTPWYLLTKEQKSLFNYVPDTLLQTIVEVCHEYVWEPLAERNKNIPITFEQTIAEVHYKSVWGPLADPNKSTGIYRLSPEWKKPSKTKPVDTVPYRNEKCPYIYIPIPYGHTSKLCESDPSYELLHVLRGRADWLWIKWEWFDKKDNRNYIWYEFPGNIVRGDTPNTGQNLREYNENPPLPVLVRWKNG